MNGKSACYIVWVRKKLPEDQVEPDQLLPKEIDGADVDVLEGEVVLIYLNSYLMPMVRLNLPIILP